MDLIEYSNEHIDEALKPVMKKIITSFENDPYFLDFCWARDDAYKQWHKHLASIGISVNSVYLKQIDVHSMGESCMANFDMRGRMKFPVKCHGYLMKLNDHNMMSIIIMTQEYIEKLMPTNILHSCHYLHSLLAPSNYDQSPEVLFMVKDVFLDRLTSRSYTMDSAPQPVPGFHIQSSALKLTSTWGLKRWFPNLNINTKGDIYTYISLLNVEKTRELLKNLGYNNRKENTMALYKNYTLGTLIKVLVPYDKQTANAFNVIIPHVECAVVLLGGEVLPIYHAFFALINCIFINTTVGNNEGRSGALQEKINMIHGCLRGTLNHYEMCLYQYDEGVPPATLGPKTKYEQNKLTVYGAMTPARTFRTMSSTLVLSRELYPRGHKTEVILESIDDEEVAPDTKEDDECEVFEGDDEIETGTLINSLRIGCGS